MNRLALALLASLVVAEVPAPAPDQDRILAAAATQLAEAHRKADALETKGELDEAVAVLERAMAQPLPAGEEGWQLRADLVARTSQLMLRAGDVAAAQRTAKKGLEEARAKPESIFVSQLWLRLGEALEAAKDDDGAVNAYQSAIDVAKAALAARQDAGRGP